MYEHESIHTYNRKAMGNLNFITPVKNQKTIIRYYAKMDRIEK